MSPPQFNRAFDGDLLKTEEFQGVAKRAGLTHVPTLIFWNVRGCGAPAYPAGMDTDNVALVAGDSDGVFASVLQADFDNLSPNSMMRDCLLKFAVDADKLVD